MNNNSKKSPVSSLCSILGTAILMAVIIICAALVVPRFFGGQFLAVVSGSMEPAVPTGSLVYVQSVNPENVEAEDIIAFYGTKDANTIVTHRVVENQKEKRQFITKGDANKTSDMNPTRYGDFIGKIFFHIPGVGFVTQAIASTPGKIACGCAAGLGLVLYLMSDTLDQKKRKKE